MKYFLGIATFCIFVAYSATLAHASVTTPDPRAAFRMYGAISVSPLIHPNVVQVDVSKLADKDSQGQYAVFNTTENRFEPTQFFMDSVPLPAVSYDVFSDTAVGELMNMYDDDPSTYAAFEVDPKQGQIFTTITVTTDPAITADAFMLTLPPNVALPRSVSLAIRDAQGTRKTVLAPTAMIATTMLFPATTAGTWELTFEHDQPLRIAEIKLHDMQESNQRTTNIRFLAAPGVKYQLYFNADRAISLTLPERPNLSDDTGMIEGVLGAATQNPLYMQSDRDHDGVPDTSDNCRDVANPDQMDADRNGIGDACEDYDHDSVMNIHDNCPNVPNVNQQDIDHDGKGDVCDQEESRFTEKHAWVPWAGIGFAAVVIVVLLVLTVRMKPVV